MHIAWMKSFKKVDSKLRIFFFSLFPVLLHCCLRYCIFFISQTIFFCNNGNTYGRFIGKLMYLRQVVFPGHYLYLVKVLGSNNFPAPIILLLTPYLLYRGLKSPPVLYSFHDCLSFCDLDILIYIFVLFYSSKMVNWGSLL